MKNMLRYVWVAVALAMLFACASCMKKDEARSTIEHFLDAVEAGDYDTAKTYLHPDRPMDLAAFFERVKQEETLDLSQGVDILRYTSIESAHYDSQVDGSRYETDLVLQVGDQRAEASFELVRNDQGYGIYELDIDLDD